MDFVFLDALISGDAGGAIERSEKRGQAEVVQNKYLPIKNASCSMGQSNDAKEQYEKMGIKVLGKEDDLFYRVALPDGWEIRATDHSMWNNVFDNNGRNRISFFYKAAFYDRDAFSNFERRFRARYIPQNQEDGIRYGAVYDCDKEIYRTKGLQAKSGQKSWDVDEKQADVAKKWLKQNYPLHEDINAYWG